MEAPPLALYVHLPWCVRKCPYCDFNSHTAGNDAPRARYIAALLADLDIEAARAQDRPLTSVFLGGGTPSLFPPADIAVLIEGIRERFEIIENAEADESVTILDLTSTTKVIDELNRFTANVMQGKIRIEEEIVMESADGDHFDLIDIGKDHLAQAQAFEIGDWIEFTDSDSKMVAARLSGKSNVTSKLVFVNRQGHKVRNITVNGLALELRSGSARSIGSSSVFDRAIHTIMTKM